MRKHFVPKVFKSNSHKKKTRQGMSNNTKYGTKISKKYYKKRKCK